MIKELKEKRAGLVKEARGMIDAADAAKRGLTAEESARYDAIMQEATGIGADIERRERLAATESTLDASSGVVAGRAQSEQPTKNDPRGTAEYRSAFATAMRLGPAYISQNEQRALASGADSTGGAMLAPSQMVDTIIRGLNDSIYIRGWATKYQIQGAKTLGAPALTTDPDDADWTTEILTGNEDSSMAFARRELTPHPLAKRLKVSNTLLQQAPNVETLITDRLTYKLALPQEKKFLLGAGTTEPLGVFVASANGIPASRDVSTGNTTTAVTFDGLISAKFGLKGQYWRNAKWLFHRDVLATVAKLKDGQGQYIWRESARVGEPDMLLGLPVFMSEFAPNTMTTGLYAGILGDFSYYWIADNPAISIQRLVELYAATNQVGFITRAETDGMPVLGEAFVRVKLA